MSLFVPATSFALWKHIHVSPVARSNGLAQESVIVQLKFYSAYLELLGGNVENNELDQTYAHSYTFNR